MTFFFVSDLHGSLQRYDKLANAIEAEKPDVVLFGGDLLPHGLRASGHYMDFVNDFLLPLFSDLKKVLRESYPKVYLILGNDDFRSEENKIINAEESGLWEYIHYKKTTFTDYLIYGYSYVPITPFGIKDWEKYDTVEGEIRPGCLPIDQGFKTTDQILKSEKPTIEGDLELFVRGKDLSNAILVMHSPPYNTFLDRAGLDGLQIDNKLLDVHVGSVAIRNFIEQYQPLMTLHGHIHESTKRTGHWKQQIGKTWSINGSTGDQELCLVKFDPEDPGAATRVLL